MFGFLVSLVNKKFMKCTSKQAELGTEEEGKRRGGKERERERQRNRKIARRTIKERRYRGGKKIRGDKFAWSVVRRRHDCWNKRFGEL